MGLFNLFGGKKKDEAKAAPAPAKDAAPAAKSAPPKPEKTPQPAPAASAPPTGSTQVKLRLRLVHSLRSGEHAAAYEAAKSLADIQAKAGRRTGARVWRDEAERIKALDPAQAA